MSVFDRSLGRLKPRALRGVLCQGIEPHSIFGKMYLYWVDESVKVETLPSLERWSHVIGPFHGFPLLIFF